MFNIANTSPFLLKSTTKLPPLLALPVELKLKIISFVSKGARVMVTGRYYPQPSLVTLRRVHRSFRQLITYDPFFHAIGFWSIDQLRAGECNVLHPLPVWFYPCYGCLAVLYVHDFDRRNTTRLKGVGGEKAHERLCQGCVSRKESRGAPSRAVAVRRAR